MEMSVSKPESDDGEEDVKETAHENKMTLDNLEKGFDYSKWLLTSFVRWTLL